ncbi:MAG: magnesium chelatase ATPase subunit I [Pseudomonadota bacterium]
MSFPFSAIVGQQDLKTALHLAAIDQKIGGVLAFGDRGTGKSTAIRALAALLPEIESIADCDFNRDPAEQDAQYTNCCPVAGKGPHKTVTHRAPVVDLPLGASEDRIIGALDLEQALVHGQKRFEPGLLARAHRGFLYIDEVNLLDDHLVDVLLDVAASGENVVEREGLSVRHPARFVLVGSGNPEEGELRPQLLDRFGLSVDVRTPTDVKERVEVVKRRDAYEQDPAAFVKKWKRKDTALRKKIEQARALVPTVQTSDDVLALAATLCIATGADGLRGELTLLRTARAMAAFEGRGEVTGDDIRAVAPMALRHRLRKDPLDESDNTARITRIIDEVFAA